jgi:hypothetical protein
MTTIQVPAHLPVKALSHSSITLFLKCPEKWRRRYIDGEYEPTNGKMLAGSAAGAAEGRNYQQKIATGEDLAIDDVLDCFSDEWSLKTEQEEIEWGEDKPGEVKDSTVLALRDYHHTIAPAFHPVAVERPFTLRFPDTDWSVTGYLDLEDASGAVADMKVKGKSLSQKDADTDMQPGMYLLGRRTEGNPATRFDFHVMNRGVKTPYAKVISTERTDAQLDALLHRIAGVAAEINWRAENDHWGYAVPGAWWCAQNTCGYWQSCPMGGAR